MTQHLLALAFAVGCGWLGGWLLLLARGRLPYTAYRDFLLTERWAATVAEFTRCPRGRRCAACGAWWGLQAHHWTYRNLGHELLWQLVMLCGPCHARVHQLSRWLAGRRSRWLWATTPLVVAWGKLLQRVGY